MEDNKPEREHRPLHALYGGSSKIRQQPRDPSRKSVRSTQVYSFEFLDWRDVNLILEVTDTKERAEAFMAHIRAIYADELRRKEDERAALRASFGYP